ncbi:MAG: hypothetical protein ABIT37_23850 [Luteolibacter sp.]
MSDRIFKQVTAEIDGKPVDIAIRIDAAKWTEDFPYGWHLLDTLNDGQ